MGFQNRTRPMFFFIVLSICVFKLRAQESKDIDLGHLYNDWAFSHNESHEDVFILRRSKDEVFLSMEERKDWYNFEKKHDSILYNERIYLGRRFICGTGYDSGSDVYTRGLCNLWTYNSTQLTLSHILYNDLGAGEQFPIFTSIYKILEVNENYIKLRLEKELFDGKE